MTDKTPASRRLLNITKAMLDSAESECEDLRADRNATIEECATVALEQRCERGTDWDRACLAVAAAIRALKDKP